MSCLEWTICVLDAWAFETKTVWGNDLSTNGGTKFFCVLGFGGDERWFEGASPDQARYVAAREIFPELSEAKRAGLGEWQ